MPYPRSTESAVPAVTPAALALDVPSFAMKYLLSDHSSVKANIEEKAVNTNAHGYSVERPKHGSLKIGIASPKTCTYPVSRTTPAANALMKKYALLSFDVYVKRGKKTAASETSHSHSKLE